MEFTVMDLMEVTNLFPIHQIIFQYSVSLAVWLAQEVLVKNNT